MNFTHPPQTDEQKDASIQLNNIGTINALNTHNWELQQKVQMLTAEQKLSDDMLRSQAKTIERLLSRIESSEEAYLRLSAENERFRKMHDEMLLMANTVTAEVKGRP